MWKEFPSLLVLLLRGRAKHQSLVESALAEISVAKIFFRVQY